MIEPDTLKCLHQNWRRVCDEVAQAAEACGRNADNVRIIGVSKYVDSAVTAALAQTGCHDLAESRPQLLWEKAEAVRTTFPLRWHLIGHLQRNKIKRTLQYNPVIHSIDSDRLLRAVARTAQQNNQTVEVLLEVNISEDPSKTGFGVAALEQAINDLPQYGVNVRGLMAMAGWGTDASLARKQFEQTRLLRDRLSHKTGHPLPELSMGMSGDFPQAIHEGATMVRIGSRLFAGLGET